MRFGIRRDGTAENAIIDTASDLTDEGVRACVLRTIGKIPFPPHELPGNFVELPLNFAPKRG